MSRIQKYIKDKIDRLDVSGIISPDVEIMQQSFLEESLFKFYPVGSDFIFDNFSIRYTQKQHLNDPFELSKRWNSVAQPSLIEKFRSYINASLTVALNNDDIIRELAFDYLSDKGIELTANQTPLLDVFLRSEAFKYHRDNALLQIKPMIDLAINALFVDEKILTDAMKGSFLDKIGILSVTENVNNIQLWSLYASSGQGYVVELAAQSDAFVFDKGSNIGKSRFQKVSYTDDNSDSFIENPLYLFLVKDKKWEFEREWRIIKSLELCNNVKGNVFTDVLLPGSVRRIIFGYNFDNSKINQYINKIRRHDREINFSIAQLNVSNRSISLQEI